MTHHELNLRLKGYSKRREDEIKAAYQDMNYLAWHIEALARVKKLPKLKDFMDGIKEQPKNAMDAEQALIQFAGMFGLDKAKVKQFKQRNN